MFVVPDIHAMDERKEGKPMKENVIDGVFLGKVGIESLTSKAMFFLIRLRFNEKAIKIIYNFLANGFFAELPQRAVLGDVKLIRQNTWL